MATQEWNSTLEQWLTAAPSPCFVEIIGPTAICRGEAAQFVATDIPGATYTWTVSPNLPFTTSRNVLTINPAIPHGTYQIRVTANLGGTQCSDDHTLKVVRIEISGHNSKETVCVGEPVQLQATVNPTVPGGTYSWSVVGAAYSISNPNAAQVVVTFLGPAEEAVVQVIYRLPGGHGCSATRLVNGNPVDDSARFRVMKVTVVVQVLRNGNWVNLAEDETVFVGDRIRFVGQVEPSGSYSYNWVGGPNTAIWDYGEVKKQGTITARLKVSDGQHTCEDEKKVEAKEKPRRLIFLFGYWPPTNTDKPPGMLKKWKTRQQYKDTKFDVWAISPEFDKSLGTELPPLPILDGQPKKVPFWGKGKGQLQVDYEKTSEDFWNLVLEHKPIAIMSFSRLAPQDPVRGWKFERWGKNNARADWVIKLFYILPNGTQTSMPWNRPRIGGSADDFSPFKNTQPKPSEPPDPTRDAGFQRDSNLPMEAMRDAIIAHFKGKRIDPVYIGTDPGNFVSGYMAYHVAWYREYINEKDGNNPETVCHFSGHTHVGVFVDRDDGEKAVEIQLDVLVEELKKKDP